MKMILSALAICVVIYSCTHSPFPVPNSTNTTDTTHHDTTKVDTTNMVDTSVCFQRDVLPIFIGSCAMSGCHSAASHAKGYNLSSYSNIIAVGLVKYNSAGSAIYTKCVSGSMPKSPVPKLDSTQLSYIRRWIDKGAPNDTNCMVVCDTNKFTFSAGVMPILKQNCTGCHSTASAASAGGGIVLDTYAGVLTQAQNGKLLGDIKHTAGFNAMPLGGNALPSCEVTQITKWINAGALNN